MRPYTSATLTSPRRSTPTWRPASAGACSRDRAVPAGVACAAVIVVNDRDPERRVVLACVLPPAELMTSAKVVRTAHCWHVPSSRPRCLRGSSTAVDLCHIRDI